MPYNESLANRVREMVALTHDDVTEKKMFGGLCFMVNGKMLAGIESQRLMVRLHPAVQEQVMEKEGVTPMDFTGRIMKGYVFVSLEALRTQNQLAYWIQLALDYNGIAKASRKKK